MGLSASLKSNDLHHVDAECLQTMPAYSIKLCICVRVLFLHVSVCMPMSATQESLSDLLAVHQWFGVRDDFSAVLVSRPLTADLTTEQHTLQLWAEMVSESLISASLCG